MESGDEANATEALRTPAEREHAMASDVLVNAEILITAGQVDRGMEVAKAALVARGDDPEFSLKVAILAVNANRLSDASEIYQKILRSHPDNIDALNGAGVVSAQKGDLVAANDSLRRALALKPGDVPTRNNLALVMLLGGENQSALTLLEDLSRTAPSPQVDAALAAARSRVRPENTVTPTVASAPAAAAEETVPIAREAAVSPPAATHASNVNSPPTPSPVATAEEAVPITRETPMILPPAVHTSNVNSPPTSSEAEATTWSCPNICKLFKLVTGKDDN
jgi:Flp pilus assembly protein TadD